VAMRVGKASPQSGSGPTLPKWQDSAVVQDEMRPASSSGTEPHYVSRLISVHPFLYSAGTPRLDQMVLVKRLRVNNEFRNAAIGEPLENRMGRSANSNERHKREEGDAGTCDGPVEFSRKDRSELSDHLHR
jgi:hypothetical protein